MIYLTVEQVLDLYALVIAGSGGSAGVRDRNGLESALAQPQHLLACVDIYASESSYWP